MNDLIKCLRTGRGGEFYDSMFFQSVGIIHETTAPYTPQQNGVAERKNKVLKEMVNSMLSYSGLSGGFWGEVMLTACYLLNRVPNKRNKITPYELWFKKRPNLNYIRVWGCRAVVRLPEPKRKTLGEKGIDCIFVGYAEHSKAYRFYVIEPNDSIAIHTVIKSRDALFDETRFSSIPRPKDLVPNTSVTSEVEEQSIVPTESPMLRRSKRGRIEKSFGPDFQVYLEDPKSFDEAMKSQDIAFWKEAINDEMDSIMGNNTCVYLLRGGAISWASKKQTCIMSSTMESEFVALAAAGKEAEWLKNLVHEIPLWPKPISPISIRCDSATTLAKAYSQVYNDKSRHLGVRHSIIRDLITNGVISVEFVRLQQNLADHLTKGLARDLVHKSVHDERNYLYECEVDLLRPLEFSLSLSSAYLRQKLKVSSTKCGALSFRVTE
ncbi:hypothetical protein L6452_18758 [Arctium lappa]|uniref:Uncharacterized protein n=1 Tax=Arctium lappa TaxID=4217 RepID=A0ACB9C6X7_ARCLA|nr:hypothetical protein L6452_18758 [Arctium lappa]